MARAEPAVACTARLRRPLRCRGTRVDHHRLRAHGVRRHGRPGTQTGAEEDRRSAPGERRDARRRPPHHPPGEVLRAWLAPARDHRHASVVHPQRRSRHRLARSTARTRQRSRMAPVVHAAPLRQLGGRPQRRLAHQPAALLRRAGAAVVPPRCRRAPVVRRGARAVTRPPPGRPVHRLPRGVHGRPARCARRVHRRPRCHGHLGHVVTDPTDRRGLGDRRRPVRPRFPHGRPPAGSRHHPHVAVRHHGPQPPRARHTTVAQRRALGLDPRPRPQEDVQAQGQRRHPDAPARAVRHRRSPVLGCIGPPGRRHCLRRGPDEDRPQALVEAAQREQVRSGIRRDR